MQLPFDAAYCINLDSSVGRWASFKPMADRIIGADVVQRWPADTPETNPPPDWWREPLLPGAWACRASHIAVLRDAIRKGARRVLVFEDDIELPEDFLPKLSALAGTLPPNFMGIILATNKHGLQLHRRYKPEIGVVKNAHCTGCYLLSAAGAMRLYSHWIRELSNVDIAWNSLFAARRDFYVARPSIAHHPDSNWSDVGKCWMLNDNYAEHLDDERGFDAGTA